MSLAGRVSSFLCTSVLGNAKLSAKGRVVTSRTYLYKFGFGHTRNVKEEQDVIRQMGRDSRNMGAETLPYWKKEFCKPKEKRYMLANYVVGKRANYKLQGLKDIVAIKRMLKWQH